jgi:hypothetical protein
VLTAALVLGGRTTAVIILATLLWVLVVQVAVLLPRLDRCARFILSGGNLPRSRLHLAYVALDGIKVVLLPVLGVVLVTGAAS